MNALVNEEPPDVRPTCPQGHRLNVFGECPDCLAEARSEAMEEYELARWKGII